MAPKKGQKMSLNAFLGDSTLGSWADEMDSLPTAPAPRTDEERARDYGRNDFSSRPDRAPLPPKEDVVLPTQPPYTAFIGNLSFDMTDVELEEFFTPHKTVSVKIITDREGKPKGFGYVEFLELEGLKDALSRSGSTLSHRTVRINVAEPPKERERGGFSSGGPDDEKFEGSWRREGPLPPLEPPRSASARNSGFGFKESSGAAGDEGPRRGARFTPGGDTERSRERSELNNDWRSGRAPMAPPEREREGRRGLGGLESPSPADLEETWSKGSKFRPNPAASDTGSVGRKFSTGFVEKGGPGSGSATPATDEGDWRTRARPGLGSRGQSDERSPPGSTPPTPQLTRRKLELLPRSTVGSAVSTPLSSPSPSSAFPSSSKANPFGSAKPVDVSVREREVEERIAKEREEAPSFTRHSLSRETSRQASTRSDAPHQISRERSLPGTTRGPSAVPRKSSSPPTSAAVRPAFSFANAAKRAAEPKEEQITKPEGEAHGENDAQPVSSLEQDKEKAAQIV